jgi:hypothetical protein
LSVIPAKAGIQEPTFLIENRRVSFGDPALETG